MSLNSRRLCALLVGLAFFAPSFTASAAPSSCQQKKKRKKKDDAKAEPTKKVEPEKPVAPPPEPTAQEREAAAEAEAQRVEAAKVAAEAASRKQSIVTPGTASRWSNKGAMTPVEAEVPITAPLPERNIPVPTGVSTPGQGLIGGDELLSARLAFSGYHLVTKGQDTVFDAGMLVPGANRDIDLLRARAMIAYERIAGSDFGVRIDGEYRPVLAGDRYNDRRINELFLSYGLTDFRTRGGPDFGVALGRVAIREAGYAQADGAAFRLRPMEEVNLGAFAGVTGNPFGYNWRLRTTEVISADWITGGAFGAFRGNDLSIAVSGVLTYGLGLDDGQKGLDRIYGHLDVGYRVTPELNLFASGWLDILPGGNLVQNVEIVSAYSPIPELDVVLGLGRFSTVVYKLQSYSFQIDPAGNSFVDPNVPIVDENGNPIVPFDGALLTAVYNAARLRVGYDVIPEVELFGLFNLLLRDTSASDRLSLGTSEAVVRFSTFRALPSAGVRYQDPDILDASLQGTLVIDKQSNTDAILGASIGRGIAGLYLSIDGRLFAGDIGAWDGGAELSFTLPRDWFPGALILFGSARYFRESLSLTRPDAATKDQLTPLDIPLAVIPSQETFLGFAGIEWRL